MWDKILARRICIRGWLKSQSMRVVPNQQNDYSDYSTNNSLSTQDFDNAILIKSDFETNYLTSETIAYYNVTHKIT